MPKSDDYTTENLLDYLYHKNYYKLSSIDLSKQTNKQTNMSITQQINFTEDDGAATFL